MTGFSDRMEQRDYATILLNCARCGASVRSGEKHECPVAKVTGDGGKERERTEGR